MSTCRYCGVSTVNNGEFCNAHDNEETKRKMFVEAIMRTCAMPGCKQHPETEDGFCREHDTQWDRDDLLAYQTRRDEGMSSYEAAVQTGLIDPHK